jgi:hypothetical protein
MSSIDGRWHLVGVNTPEDQIPQHRVDLVFHDDTDGLRGAILSRHDGSEIPLQAVAVSDGNLRFKMGPAPGEPATDSPFLLLTAVEDRFEGAWDMPGAEHLRLKLVRSPRP